MYQFISCIKLKPGVTVDAFRQSLEQFTAHLLSEDLVVSVSPLGRRDRHPVMDTDEERDHPYDHAVRVHDMTRDWYRDIGYAVVEVPKATVADRAQFALEIIRERSG